MAEITKCCSCGGEMQLVQRIPFRIKGTPGLWKLFVGEWAELGEEMLSLDAYVCPLCGKARFSIDENRDVCCSENHS